MALPERRNTILTFIVDDYISTAVPVSSNAVAKSGGFNVSSATIRNEMGALIDQGYLLRPHTSAGAVPSEKGYRHFVGGLDHSSPPPDGLVTVLRQQMDITPDDVDAWVRVAASVIADLIGALAFITAPRAKMPDVKQIELLRLHDMLVMLVLVLQEARVYRQVIELEREISDPQLERTRNKVSAQVSGKGVEELVANRDREDIEDDFERQVWEATVEALVHTDSVPGERYMSGFRHFISDPELAAQPQRGALALSALENDDTFADLISGVTYGAQPLVAIGSDNNRPELFDYSLIMCGYGGAVNARGVVGLISPMRTAYDRAIPTVGYAAETLDAMVNRGVNDPN
jgi:heat-inducible transcriptional repressor